MKHSLPSRVLGVLSIASLAALPVSAAGIQFDSFLFFADEVPKKFDIYQVISLKDHEDHEVCVTVSHDFGKKCVLKWVAEGFNADADSPLVGQGSFGTIDGKLKPRPNTGGVDIVCAGLTAFGSDYAIVKASITSKSCGKRKEGEIEIGLASTPFLNGGPTAARASRAPSGSLTPLSRPTLSVPR